MIRVDALTVRFKTATGLVDAVRGASFHVAAGEVFGLVGESGSGKSTILRALSGLTPVAEGSLHIAGSDRDMRRRDVQMVFQDPYGSLHPRFTVDQTLREPLRINGIGDHEARILNALRAAAGLRHGRRRKRRDAFRRPAAAAVHRPRAAAAAAHHPAG
jgi:peptide/nickel transport system ATP-binding protein